MNLRNVPQRLGASLVVIVGIGGVVGVLVSILAMSEGFRHTLASTGRSHRVIMLRSGSDTELSSGLPREQATLLGNLPGVARDAGGTPAGVGRADGDGGPAAAGRDESQQRAVPRRAAGGLRDPRRAPDRGRAPVRARRARGDRGPEGLPAVRRAERRLEDRLPRQRLDRGRRLRERRRRARIRDLGGCRGGHVGVPAPGLPVGHRRARRRLGEPASGPSRRRSAAIRASRSRCCASRSTMPGRPGSCRT